MTEECAGTFGKTRLSRLRGRLFHWWFLLRRPMTLGVRIIVLDEEKRSVLLVRHTYVPGWQLPGGGVEIGETLADAVTKELAEEANIAASEPARLLSVHFNRHASRRDHVAVFLLTRFRQTAPRAPDHEIAEARFFPLDALPENLSPGARRRLREALEGTAPSPFW
ncbi:MAG: NUDIX domain-containing protein [Phyllobacteriaceae bacterium]|nr:NUDIX domain-containing protein [Phyllobacteriaceae bacterium]